MKRNFLIIFFVFLYINLYSQEIFEFRGFKWGTNSNTIIKSEGTPDEIIDLSSGLNSNILLSFPGIKVLHYLNKKASII